MMREIFVISDNIVSPLGSTTAGNFDQLKKNVSGIRKQEDKSICPDPFYAALLAKGYEERDQAFTPFEQLLSSSIADALHKARIDPADKKTIFIISTTKGNIGLLETQAVTEALEKRIALHHSARLIAGHYRAANEPLVVSHACISGLLAIITAMRMLQSGLYENAVVAGADLISRFVLSGFQSFQAISAEPCRPFDADRKGISLGEGAATLILSSNKNHSSEVRVCGGSVSNDANHISGPSRTGEELFQAISKALTASGISAKDIGFISAHGTATLYNDEMEAKAINLADMQEVPVNSLKGYYGHTLGAAGLIESVIAIQSLKENLLLPTLGFRKPGTSKSIRVSDQRQTGSFSHCLKTASGFGGCNAALVFSK
jgi:3-oxoacyl-[acyl-carrier-protein] synthase-1